MIDVAHVQVRIPPTRRMLHDAELGIALEDVSILDRPSTVLVSLVLRLPRNLDLSDGCELSFDIPVGPIEGADVNVSATLQERFGLPVRPGDLVTADAVGLTINGLNRVKLRPV